MIKHRLSNLTHGVSLLLDENRYEFSDADKALLEEILEELNEMSKDESGANSNRMFEVLSLVLRYLRFFGIDDVSNLF